jgi:nucleotide-binding universal stress UspA family protein
MFCKILTALDSTGGAEQVFVHSVELARARRARLMLVHVLTYEDDGFPLTAVPAPGDLFGRLGKAAYWHYRHTRAQIGRRVELRLAALGERARRMGVVAEHSLPVGEPERLVCAVARDWGADLIVVGRRAQSGHAVGSVTNYVLHHAPCSVLVLPLKDGRRA